MKRSNEPIFENGQKLPLIEQFYSIQGEGYHMGKAAYFIRIGGCDIGCSWCDSKLSWSFGYYELTDIDEIVNNIIKSKADSIVVTGGEPTLYNLNPLCTELKKRTIRTFIETSGAYRISGQWDWICLSPKKQNPPVAANYTKAHELKVIISKPEDFLWAEENSVKVNENCKLFLQPEWSKYQTIIPYIVEYVKKNTKWLVSLQAHKFMHIP